ncbi:MAG: hypothetical protein A2Y78_00080 [Acidobacteria bacterium RBG_13_68_16]|nr:MAG: hypothetical protein A2Y78_00080 [Acidobacteria bacterium RBG_13_68_16]
MIKGLQSALEIVNQERARARRHRTEAAIGACDAIARRLRAVLDAAEVQASMSRIPGPLESRAIRMVEAVRRGAA